MENKVDTLKSMNSLKQISNLIIKDLKVNKGTFSVIIFVYLTFLSLILIIENKFDLILVFFAVLLINTLSRQEDKFNIKDTFCSLPIKRAYFIYSKYIISILILFALIILSFLSFFLIRFLLSDILRDSVYSIDSKLLIFATFFYFIFVSVSFFMDFKFKNLGYPISLIIELLLSIVFVSLIWAFIYLLTSIYSGNWQFLGFITKDEFLFTFFLGIPVKAIQTFGETLFYLFLFLFGSLFVFISLKLSIYNYNNRDF